MKTVYGRIQEIKRIMARGNTQQAREAMNSLVRRYGKRRDNIGMTVRVAKYHMFGSKT